MSDWNRFNDQFREDEDERAERWRSIKAKRKAEGKCWQCAKLLAECVCRARLASAESLSS
jgi:hypothetical protein